MPSTLRSLTPDRFDALVLGTMCTHAGPIRTVEEVRVLIPGMSGKLGRRLALSLRRLAQAGLLTAWDDGRYQWPEKNLS